MKTLCILALVLCLTSFVLAGDNVYLYTSGDGCDKVDQGECFNCTLAGIPISFIVNCNSTSDTEPCTAWQYDGSQCAGLAVSYPIPVSDCDTVEDATTNCFLFSASGSSWWIWLLVALAVIIVIIVVVIVVACVLIKMGKVRPPFPVPAFLQPAHNMYDES